MADIPTFGSMTPRPYQWEAIQNIKQFIREQLDNHKNGKPVKNAILNASVSAGKSLIMGAVADHCQKVGVRCMVLTDVGELCDQNGKEMWDMDVKVSYYSDYVKAKSNYFTVVSATVGTVLNVLNNDFVPYTKKIVNPDNSMVDKTLCNVPTVLLIDECFAGDTMVTTRNGIFRIDDVNLIYQEILCIDEKSMKAHYHKPVRVFSNGLNSISRIQFNGGEVKCTSTHLLYSERSWVQARDLKVGQNVTLDGSLDFVLIKLLRASVAVVKKLYQLSVKDKA